MRAVLALAVLVVAACTTESGDELHRAKQKAGEALSAVAGAVAAQSDPYRRQLDARLVALTARIEKLRRDAGRLSGEARAQAEERVTKLESERDELADRVRELGDKGSGALEAARRGLDQTLDDLESGCEDVREALR